MARAIQKADMMRCEDFEPFIDAFIDEEFGDRESSDMEAHLSVCSCCRQKVESQARFKEQFKASLPLERAPESLRTRLLLELEACEVERCSNVRSFPSVGKVGWIVGPLAAMVALVVVLPELTVAPAASGQLPVIDSTVEWHRGNYPLEVTTANEVEAQDWFQDKVDFSVRLPQFGEQRVNLLGGRIAHVEERRAALVLYEVEGARLSVILFDGDGLRVPRDTLRRVEDRDIVWLSQKGYSVAVVQDQGVTYAMTSDLPEERFLQVVESALMR